MKVEACKLFPSLKYFTWGGQFCPNYSFFGGSGVGFGPEGQAAPYSQPFSSRAAAVPCPKCPHQLPQPGHREPDPGHAPAAALLAELQSQVEASPRPLAVINSGSRCFSLYFFFLSFVLLLYDTQKTCKTPFPFTWICSALSGRCEGFDCINLIGKCIAQTAVTELTACVRCQVK